MTIGMSVASVTMDSALEAFNPSAQTSEPVSIPIESLTLDFQYQPRESIDDSYAKTLAEVADELPPILCARRGDTLLVIDGWHRVRALQYAGYSNVMAQVIDVSEDIDLLALAFAHNARHGKPLTLSEKRREARRLLTHYGDSLTYREIGRRVGLSHVTVSAIARDIERESINRDGQHIQELPVVAVAPQAASASHRREASHASASQRHEASHTTDDVLEPSDAERLESTMHQLARLTHNDEYARKATASAIAGYLRRVLIIFRQWDADWPTSPEDTATLLQRYYDARDIVDVIRERAMYLSKLAEKLKT